MTLIEKFNLTWLAHAMTESPYSNAHYYYDSKNSSFFQIKTPLQYDGGIELYDTMGIELPHEDYLDIFMRFANTYTLNGVIIEISKLSTMQKRDIQLQFLNMFCCHKYHFNYFVVVIEQPEHGSFVLDRIINNTEDEHLFLLWEKFKLEIIRTYANGFAHTRGLELNLMA